MEFALAQVGAPYMHSYGPIGYDCSGLVMTAEGKDGVTLPWNSGQQAQWFKKRNLLAGNTRANRARLLPGDVVFWYGSIASTATISHCAVYVGRSLGRFMVVAAVDEAHGVMRHRLNWALPPVGFGLLSAA